MLPSPIRPAVPVAPVKRRWHAPEHKHEDGEAAKAPRETPDTLRDSDDEHIDEYAR